MDTYNGKLIWQPMSLDIIGSDFSVLLNNEFAQMMKSTKLSEDRAFQLNELIRSKLNRKAFHPHIIFYEDTALATTFNIGSGGKWLAIDGSYSRNPLETIDDTIKYTSHNCDTTTDRDILLRMVHTYVDYSDIFTK